MAIDEGKVGIGTRCVHAGQSPEPRTGAVMTPIFQTSTYAQPELGRHTGYEYSRTQNPTREALQDCIAALETPPGEDPASYRGFAFASGLAASDTLMHTLSAGDHVICGDDLYGGTWRLFARVLTKHGLEFSFIDLSEPGRLEEAWQDNTRMVWLETPTNPLLKVFDIAEIARRARALGGRTAVDNTFSTPCFQQPLALGADVVVHSTTKYLNGHSDVVGGAIVTADAALAEELEFLQNAVGAVTGPMDSWLVLRGLKTLHLRMARHADTAMQIARFLEAHPKVTRVLYPGLESHPNHALAQQQMSGFGGMISFDIDADLEGVKRFFAALRIFTLAESLGGVESLIEHPGIMTHASVPEDQRAALGIGDTLIRLSVGVEEPADLLADLETAFEA